MSKFGVSHYFVGFSTMHKLSYFLPVNRWEMGEGFGKNWKDVWGVGGGGGGRNVGLVFIK